MYPSDDETLASLIAKCREKTWPHLKNSTRQHYEFFMDKYLLPAWGTMRLRKMSVIELQDFFNSFHPRLSPKSIRLMHACMRVHLNQAKIWEMIGKNPAIGVKLPRKKQRKPTILLPLATVGRLIELLPEPTKTVVVLIVFGSLRIGEVLALRWRHLQTDRINIEERVYEGEFDDVKTDAGERQVPFDKCGLMMSALIGRWNASKHRQADDLVFSTRKGGTLGRRNLLRHIKAAATQLGLSKAVDFRSFRTMHSSLMLREGARPEVVRDNMGHANIDVTQNVYGKSWWEERVDAVTRAVEAVTTAAREAEKEAKKDQPESISNEAKSASCLRIMVGERGFEPPTPWSRTWGRGTNSVAVQSFEWGFDRLSLVDSCQFGPNVNPRIATLAGVSVGLRSTKPDWGYMGFSWPS